MHIPSISTIESPEALGGHACLLRVAATCTPDLPSWLSDTQGHLQAAFKRVADVTVCPDEEKNTVRTQLAPCHEGPQVTSNQVTALLVLLLRIDHFGCAHSHFIQPLHPDQAQG
jgi:hypothetical protein